MVSRRNPRPDLITLRRVIKPPQLMYELLPWLRFTVPSAFIGTVGATCQSIGVCNLFKCGPLTHSYELTTPAPSRVHGL